MKILFSADWHIKLGQKNIPKKWAINRYRSLFNDIHNLENEVDYHIIGGDLFDRMPNLEELELYFEFIQGVNIPTLIFPGNHEAIRKTTSFLSSLKKVSSNINNNITIIDDYHKLENIDIIPYNKLKSFDPTKFSGDILCTHVRGDIPPHVVAEIDLNLFSRWNTVFAGDLHSHENSQKNIIYPGSPITTSFHRNIVDTGVLIFDNDTLNWSWIQLDLPQLLRKTVSNTKEMVSTDYHHTIYELEGDMSELSKIDDKIELLDKKIIKRKTEASLILDQNMSIEEELIEYLRYILELNEDKVTGIIGVFNDYNKKVEME